MTQRMLAALAVSFLSSWLMAPALSASGPDCEQVYRTCERQMQVHASCAHQHPEALVADAAAIFELEHRLETADSVAAFAPDPSTKKHLRQALEGLLNTADSNLRIADFAETVLMDDLHYRHAERLRGLLAAPRSCEASKLARLERSCRAGAGEVRALTQGGGWPASVATCMSE